MRCECANWYCADCRPELERIIQLRITYEMVKAGAERLSGVDDLSRLDRDIRLQYEDDVRDVLEAATTVGFGVFDREVKEPLLQAMWNALGILGWDQDGDPTPSATVAAMGVDGFIGLFLREVRAVAHEMEVDVCCVARDENEVKAEAWDEGKRHVLEGAE